MGDFFARLQPVLSGATLIDPPVLIAARPVKSLRSATLVTIMYFS
jgi:hypothetical protein